MTDGTRAFQFLYVQDSRSYFGKWLSFMVYIRGENVPAEKLILFYYHKLSDSI